MSVTITQQFNTDKKSSEKISRTQYSLKEVSMHDSWEDCWIIIYDRVYDITKFLELHPGGDDLLMEYAGRDASLAFRGTGHSQEATNMLKQYEIGELVPHEQIYRCESGKLSFTETFIL
ncbi:cytochrome b5 type B-like [Culicoides brevitarsis]|uniref:cytochrome b5 type B-like n=1 Tax=Culicoides brevitarsis TaxID=469753 RepID=UPI00307C003B